MFSRRRAAEVAHVRHERGTALAVDTARSGGLNRLRPSLRPPIRGFMATLPATTVCRLNVNGDERECAVAPHTTLLEALRYGLGLTGSKQGCDACTVAVDGTPVLACVSVALASQGRRIGTVEGLATGGRLHPG